MPSGRRGGRNRLAYPPKTPAERTRVTAAVAAIAGMLALGVTVIEAETAAVAAQHIESESVAVLTGATAATDSDTVGFFAGDSVFERGIRLFGTQAAAPADVAPQVEVHPTGTDTDTESAAPSPASPAPTATATAEATTRAAEAPSASPTATAAEPITEPTSEATTPTPVPTEPPPTPFGVSSVPVPTATAVASTDSEPSSADSDGDSDGDGDEGAPPSSTNAASDPAPFGQTGSWRLAFRDEFNGNEIDTSVWEPGWFESSGFSRPVNDNGDACFHPDQVRVSGGLLELRVDAETDPACVKKDGTTRANYVGALVNTRESFTFSYGYAEARIFLPSTDGSLHNWPAFWHTGFDWPETGEVDIVEGLSGGQPCSVYHYASPSGEHLQDKSCVDWSEPGGWHVFAANWEPGKITFYFDYVEVFSTTDGVTGDPHYLILDMAVNEDYGVVTGTSMFVDYVHVWQPV